MTAAPFPRSVDEVTRSLASRVNCSWRVALVAVLVSALTTLSITWTIGPSSAATSNPAHNVATPPLADGSGECTGENASHTEVTNCASPCYPSYAVRADGTAVFPLANTPRCTNYVLTALNVAQRHEHVRAIILPRNYYRLSVPEQLFVWANLERVTRGLPPLVGLVPFLNQVAENGAVHDQDPVITNVHYDTSAGEWAAGPLVFADHFEGGTSIWAGGDSSTADAMFGWMYDDGWGGSAKTTSNIACTSAHARGCWGHRDNILGSDFGPGCHVCVAGAAYAASSNERTFPTSFSMIFVEPANVPAMSFSWNADVVPFLPVAYERVRAD